MTTSYHSPWAKVRFGNGTKLALITKYDPVKNTFTIHNAKERWGIAIQQINPLFYKTGRTIPCEEVIKTWRHKPSLQSFKKAK